MPYPNVLVVEASAGTGKTYALATRYIRQLLSSREASGPLALQEVLAVTFSNKAMAQMRSRILEFLKRLALDAFADERSRAALLEACGVDAADARSRATRLVRDLLGHYNFYQVKTIDSFINAIVSGCAFKLGLSANFRIRHDAPRFLATALDLVIERAARDAEVRRSLARWLHQYLYIEEKTGWFPKTDLFRQASGMFAAVNRTGAAFTRVPWDVGELLAQKKALLEDAKVLRAALPKGTYKKLTDALEKFVREATPSFDLGDVSKYLHHEIPDVKAGETVPAKAQALWDRVRQGLERIAFLEATVLFNAPIDVFGLLLADLRRLEAREDVLFLDELNARARALFDEGVVTVPELYVRLALRVRHYLIDEFQDTSPLQWRNLGPMITDALAAGGSLFYVGDKKQAIYRFRGGDVTLFDGLKKELAAFNVTQSALGVNYRSRHEIVRFTNEVFSRENLEGFLARLSTDPAVKMTPEAQVWVLDLFAGAQQDVREGWEGGCVRVETLEPSSGGDEAGNARARLWERLETLRERRAWREIAVLVRTNDEVEEVSSWLLERRIPVASERTLSLRHNPRIKEFTALLAFLKSPIDNLAFVSFILGDIFLGASGFSREATERFVMEARVEARGRSNFIHYLSFRERYPRVWEDLFEPFFGRVGFVPLYELVIGLWERLRIFERFPEDHGFFLRFLELVRSREEEGPGLGAFLEFFEKASDEELYLSGVRTDAVQVMTIHKAKGLEFPVVILPLFSMEAKVEERRPLTFEEPSGLVMRRVTKKLTEWCPALETVYRHEYARVFVDELNSAYVALTRSIDEIYVHLLADRPRSANFLRELLPEVLRADRGNPATRPAAKGVSSPVRALTPCVNAEWVKGMKGQGLDALFLEKREARRQGRVVHEILAEIGDMTGGDPVRVIGEAVRRVLNRGKADPESVEGWGDRLTRLIDVPEVRELFFVPGCRVSAEQEVVDSAGRLQRIDRLIVGDREVRIVDFKSSRGEAEAGRGQVAGYIQLIQDVYPKRRVRGLLVFLDTLSCEEIA